MSASPRIDRMVALAIMALLAALAGSGLAAQPAPLTAQAFAAQLGAWRQQVDQLRAHPSQAAALAHALPDEWLVAQDGAVMHVSTQWLRRGLLQIRADSQRPAKVADARHPPKHSAQDDIGLLDHAIAARIALLEGNSANTGAARGELRAILARPEFRGVHPPSAASRAKNQIWAWIRAELNRLLSHVAAHPTVLQGLVWLVMLIAMGIAVRLVWKHAGSADGSPRAPRGADDRPSARSWQSWQQQARAAAATGNYREAIHLAYWSAISWLEAGGAWIPDRARTPREYLRLLPAASPHAGGLRALTRIFERVWYAGRPAAAADFDTMLRQLEEMGCV